jgi:hypothetical protein
VREGSDPLWRSDPIATILIVSGGRRRPTGHAGIALVEVLVAGALFAIAVVAVFPLFLSSRRSNAAAEAYAQANLLAREAVERLTSLPFDDPRLAAGDHPANDLPAARPDPETGRPSDVPHPFRRTYRVRQFAIPEGATVPRGDSFRPIRVALPGLRFDYKRIDVTVLPALAGPGLGVAAVRVSAIVANPAPEAMLSNTDPDP